MARTWVLACNQAGCPLPATNRDEGFWLCEDHYSADWAKRNERNTAMAITLTISEDAAHDGDAWPTIMTRLKGFTFKVTRTNTSYIGRLDGAAAIPFDAAGKRPRQSSVVGMVKDTDLADGLTLGPWFNQQAERWQNSAITIPWDQITAIEYS